MPAVEAATAAPPACECDHVVVEDLFGFLRVLNDGTVLRAPDPVFCPTTFPDSHPSVQWKEAIYDKPKNLRVRMYKPLFPSPAGAGSEATTTGNKTKKLPVLVHFHGGGFCLGSCTWANVHAFCLRLAAEARAVVLSAPYRLAPEHRLPAQLDDGAGFMRWLADQSSSSDSCWLADAADLGRVFVTGDSAGGTIAHHLAVRAGSVPLAAHHHRPKPNDDPVTVRGYVLLMPFFGGAVRTASEAECPAEVFLNLDLSDRFWRLSLPAGATRDHPAANPFGPDSPPLRDVEFRPVLVVVGGHDMLRDRAVDYVDRLVAMGKPVELAEFTGEPHGFYTLEPGSKATGELIRVLSRFVDASSSSEAATTVV
ncbi:hypothetical protein PR202_gb12335 [Eleusine coracana subsp. coracana]|uniref:Alpha/beta hydrolase fold-3 domain-containing protein n=1 Tax=Eleusine coracana subsp. coracana TaxID=191504 RepID=A0AAV5EQT3_ELECO|nr:hypothetical protein PR202_gb12335 [Eleusine coracana subsp. coracana]